LISERVFSILLAECNRYDRGIPCRGPVIKQTRQTGQTGQTGPTVQTSPIGQNIHFTLNYTVYFGSDIFQPENELLRDIIVGSDRDLPKKLFFIIDSGVACCHPRLAEAITAYCRRHAHALALAAAPLVLPGGEQVKNDSRFVDDVHRAIREAGLCRHSYLAVIGGGALIDMAGYAAATAHRGIRLVRIPTTVLAQADAALGVKNGINAHGRKNFIGTFAVPWAVINDAVFLKSLSDRDWISGVAEALKVALIKDAAFFEFIEGHADALRQRDMAVMGKVIHRCASLHLTHITTSGDPFESGSSRPLDFGHWSAHWLEQAGNYGLRHGEAVAIGMAIDAAYSCLVGLLDPTHWRRIVTTLRRLGFRLSAPELSRTGDIVQGLKEFQEHLGGALTIMLLAEIGRGVEVHAMEPELIRKAIAQVLESEREEGI